MHWILMVFVGFILIPGGSVMDFLFPAISVAFLWQYTTMINDIYDIDIDRKAHPERPLVTGEISTRDYRSMARISLIISFLFAFLSGMFVIAANTVALFLAMAYSIPPLRLRNRWYGSIIMGSGSALEVFAGYSSHYWPGDSAFFHLPVFTAVFWTVLAIVLFALSLAPNITAYKDYEGDVENGVETIYTLLGKKKGKMLMSAILPVFFLLPLGILYSNLNLAFSALFGIMASFLFLKYESAKSVFLLYFIELLYFIIVYLKL